MDADPLSNAISHLATAGLQATIVADRPPLLRVSGPLGTQTYSVLERSRVNVASALDAPTAVEEHRPLVVTPYVSEKLADAWRSLDIHYVDSVGNMYLRGDGLLIDIRGHRRSAAHRPAEPGRSLRAFKSGGVKILFALLTRPDLTAAPFREIALASGTSLGTVQWVLKELDELGYVGEIGQARRLFRTRDLFNRWVEAYTFNLWPTLTLARFDSSETAWFRNKPVRLDGAQWGGETAASILNPYLRPAGAVIYASGIPVGLIQQHRLRKAAGDGNVEIRDRFWNFQQGPDDVVVPTPLIYADLVASEDPRLLEAANMLRGTDELLGRIDGSRP